MQLRSLLRWPEPLQLALQAANCLARAHRACVRLRGILCRELRIRPLERDERPAHVELDAVDIGHVTDNGTSARMVIPAAGNDEDDGRHRRDASFHARYLIRSTVETLPSP